MAAISGPPARWDAEADVVTIGAGACGITAGLRAREQGADVIVLEREPRPSGSTAMSSGFVPAPGTRWQRALGVEDNPAAFAAEIQRKAADGAHPGITQTVTQTIAPALEWLADRHGLEWVVLDDFLYPGHSCHRMHAVPEKSGAGLMARLMAAASEDDLTIVTDARADALVLDDDWQPEGVPGKIEGVVIERPDGARETIRADAVILACNGYGGNRALVEGYIPEIAPAIYHGHAGNTGDAVLWGQKIGAGLRDLSAYQGHGNLAHPHGILITWALMMEGGIQVNQRGQRFSNEHAGYSEQGVKVLAQPGGTGWAIYDERLHNLGMEFPDYRDAWSSGAVYSGNASEIARMAALPASAFTSTLLQSRECAKGAFDPFGRNFSNAPPLGEKLHAIKVTAALFHTQGGLDIDADARVVGPRGDPFPNLFAAGGAACGVSGSRVEGYLSGNGLLTAIALGWVAGKAAAGI